MSEDIEKSQTLQNHFLIEVIYKKAKRSIFKPHYWVQGKPYFVGLKVKNIGSECAAEAIIKNLKINPANGGSISTNFVEQFNIPALNPNQEIDFYWPDPTVLVIQGSCWIDCEVEAKDKTTQITTYQLNSYVTKPQKFDGLNSWGNALIVRGEIEQQQSSTNFLLLILTILMFLDGVWGLDNILSYFSKMFGNFLLYVGNFLLGK